MSVIRIRPLVLGLGLVLATNVVALAGIAYNRTGEPESVLALSERELAVPGAYGFDSENSGISLRLNWRISLSANIYERHAEWLDAEKLKELGFNLPPANDSKPLYRSQLEREAYLVLELNGKSYEAALARAREHAKAEGELAQVNPDKKEFQNRSQLAQRALEREERAGSRLFVIDVGLDAERLRAKYPDRSRYAVVHGTVRPVLRPRDRKQRNQNVDGLAVWYGIVDVAASHIHVPLAHRAAFPEPAKTWTPEPVRPRFTTTVAFGRRLEPWILDARAVRNE